jgi:phosphate transport system permease protein
VNGSLEGSARDRARRRISSLFTAVCGLATAGGLAALGSLLVHVVAEGAGAIGPVFLRAGPARLAEDAGIGPAVAGSLWIVALSAAVAVPIAVGAAVWLEEYAPRTWTTRAIETNIRNLAGVPSIVYGIIGLTVFAGGLGLGRTVLAGALTLVLFVLPLLVLTVQDALRALPPGLREASWAVGATRWQVVRRQLLPAALPRIASGTILTLARALGEAAPIVLVVGIGFVSLAPSSPGDVFTALPLQIFDWARRPQADFQARAAGASLVLLVAIVVLNALAAWIRLRRPTGRDLDTGGV